jgi:hypothetical protein
LSFEDVRNYSSHSNVVSILELHHMLLGFGLFVVAQFAMAKWIMEAFRDKIQLRFVWFTISIFIIGFLKF